MKANTCPYCGGPYTLAETCNGPRTDDPTENTCAAMARACGAVVAATEEDPGELNERSKLCVKCDGPITTPLLVGDELCVHCADYDPDDPDIGEIADIGHTS